jgi:hypothetical protein
LADVVFVGVWLMVRSCMWERFMLLVFVGLHGTGEMYIWIMGVDKGVLIASGAWSLLNVLL